MSTNLRKAFNHLSQRSKPGIHPCFSNMIDFYWWLIHSYPLALASETKDQLYFLNETGSFRENKTKQNLTCLKQEKKKKRSTKPPCFLRGWFDTTCPKEALGLLRPLLFSLGYQNHLGSFPTVFVSAPDGTGGESEPGVGMWTSLRPLGERCHLRWGCMDGLWMETWEGRQSLSPSALHPPALGMPIFQLPSVGGKEIP